MKRKVNAPSREERRQRIQEGTWFGRGTVFATKKSYRRQRLKQEARHIAAEESGGSETGFFVP